MGASTIGIIGSMLVSIVFFILFIVCLVFAIIIMIKLNKALSIWIRKNDDMNIQPPPVQPNPNENSI